MAGKLVAAVIAVFVVSSYLLGFYRIDGNRMFPALKDGDLVVTNRRSTGNIGDIISYRAKDGSTQFGRLIAMGGQEVDFPDDGGYTVDGKAITDDSMYETGVEPAYSKLFPVQVPEGSCFVLNDLRSDMSDSRMAGCVSCSDIKGRVIFVLRRRSI